MSNECRVKSEMSLEYRVLSREWKDLNYHSKLRTQNSILIKEVRYACKRKS
jgi:hypothetical protein